MSGDYTGVLITPPERRGTWAEYEYAPNIGVLIIPERRGTWAEYGTTAEAPAITGGTGWGGNGFIYNGPQKRRRRW